MHDIIRMSKKFNILHYTISLNTKKKSSKIFMANIFTCFLYLLKNYTSITNLKFTTNKLKSNALYLFNFFTRDVF